MDRGSFAGYPPVVDAVDAELGGVVEAVVDAVDDVVAHTGKLLKRSRPPETLSDADTRVAPVARVMW
jgi:hypothetical protein